MSLSDEAIYTLTEAMVAATPGHLPRAEWLSRMRRRMLQEGTLEQRGAAP
jgi:hypothetical protein